MRINKLFGARSITNLLYGLIMFLPFMAILGRVIYTQSNPNAKDSYTGSVSYLTTQNINTFLNTTTASETNEYVVNNNTIYKLNNYNLSGDIHSNNYNTDTLSNWTQRSYTIINFSTIEIDNVNYEQAKSIVFYSYSSGFCLIGLMNETYNPNNLYFGLGANWTPTYYNSVGEVYSIGTRFWILNNSQNFTKYTINLINNENNIYYNTNYTTINLLEKNIFYTETTLSNAFEYSLDMFINNNANINNINFFGWFNGLFLNQSNTHNMLYLNFANWYMNYALLVSSGYLLFLALMWFINYVRRILDKSQNIDFGGF